MRSPHRASSANRLPATCASSSSGGAPPRTRTAHRGPAPSQRRSNRRGWRATKGSSSPTGTGGPDGASTALTPDAPPEGCGELASGLPVVCVGHRVMHVLFGTVADYALPYKGSTEGRSTEPPVGTVGERIEVTPLFDGWGTVHLLDAGTLQELDAYAIAEGTDASFARGEPERPRGRDRRHRQPGLLRVLRRRLSRRSLRACGDRRGRPLRRSRRQRLLGREPPRGPQDGGDHRRAERP
jgi:hypothetical protein